MIKSYLKNLLLAGTAGALLAGCGREDPAEARQENLHKSAIYAVLCSNKISECDLEYIITKARVDDRLYQTLVDDVVHTMRSKPMIYKDELLDCCATAVYEFREESRDIFGFIYAQSALQNLRLMDKDGGRGWE